jgi:cytochrome c-type biogenesis protein CcmH
MNCKYFYLIILGVFIISGVNAADIPFHFDNEADAEQYYSLTHELRCMVCQNQSLADSNADLAQDLRNEVYRMVKEGQTSEQIITYLVDRYGDFVLYRPPLKATTYLLWFGPFIIFLLTIALLIRVIHKRKQKLDDLDTVERDHLSESHTSQPDKKLTRS